MKQFFFLLASFLVFISAFAAHASSSFEEDFTLPIVYINILVDVGAAQDGPAKLGLANIASRMILRGTQKRSKLAYFEQLNRLGGQLEMDVRTEGTVIRGAVLSENLEKFLALVEETLTQPKFTSAELTKLKKEVEGEILEQKGNDKSLVQYHYNRFLYGAHPYGNPVIGTRKGVESVNYKDVIEFYGSHYSGDTLTLFGTGAAQRQVVESWFERLGQRLTALHPSAHQVASVAKPEFAKGRRALIVDKPKTTQTQILMGGQGMRPELPGFYAVMLANHSFGGHSFQARMMQEIRVKRGWTYGAANTFRFGRETRHFGMYVFPKTEDTPPAIELMLGLFDDFVKNGITRDEFAFARDSLVNNAPFNFDTSKKRLENATTEHLLRFPMGYNRDFADRIKQVRFDEIKPALKEVFSPENLALTVVGDASKLKEPLSKIKGFDKIEIKPFLED